MILKKLQNNINSFRLFKIKTFIQTKNRLKNN